MKTGFVRAGLVAGLALWAGSVVAAPPAQAPQAAPVDGGDARLLRLVEHLGRLGEQQSQTQDPAAIASSSLQQADVVTQILAIVKGGERAVWLRHLADCLAAATMNHPAGDQAAYGRLLALKQELDRTMPGSAVTAHAAYLEVQAAYMIMVLTPGADVRNAQDYRRQRLSEFVKEYPRAEEAPGVLKELAKEAADREEVSKAQYRQLVETHPNHPDAVQARGALRRMEMRGQVLDLSLPLLNDPVELYHISRLEGQVVVVYCYAADDERHRRNCETLRHFWDEYAQRGLTFVFVNLEATQSRGQKASAGVTLPAVQLYAVGGLEGRWAREQGVTEVPTLFLLGKDGRVVTQLAGKEALAEELKTLLPEKARGAGR
jgi:hypothetical protein